MIIQRAHLALSLLVLAGCGSHPVKVPGALQANSFGLTCPSFLGDLKTQLVYTVVADFDPVTVGGSVTYTINAPLVQVDSPVTPSFRSSTTTFNIPAGLAVQGIHMDPASNKDFTSTETKQTDTQVGFVLHGDFTMDGKEHPVPSLVVVARVTAKAGDTIRWDTPVVVSGTANAGLFGDQTSDCHIDAPGAIGSSRVVDP
jgi:hypothetical protein